MRAEAIALTILAALVVSSVRAASGGADVEDRLPKEGAESTLPWMEPFRFESQK